MTSYILVESRVMSVREREQCEDQQRSRGLRERDFPHVMIHWAVEIQPTSGVHNLTWYAASDGGLLVCICFSPE